MRNDCYRWTTRKEFALGQEMVCGVVDFYFYFLFFRYVKKFNTDFRLVKLYYQQIKVRSN